MSNLAGNFVDILGCSSIPVRNEANQILAVLNEIDTMKADGCLPKRLMDILYPPKPIKVIRTLTYEFADRESYEHFLETKHAVPLQDSRTFGRYTKISSTIRVEP